MGRYVPSIVSLSEMSLHTLGIDVLLYLPAVLYHWMGQHQWTGFFVVSMGGFVSPVVPVLEISLHMSDADVVCNCVSSF